VPCDTHITVRGLLIVADSTETVKYKTTMKAIFLNLWCVSKYNVG